MTTIYLARHGQDEDNLNGVLNGHRDQPLTDLGEKQALITAEHLMKEGLAFDFIYSSPLRRAYRTAQIIADVNNQPPPQKFDQLIERDFGTMEVKLVSDIEKLCAPSILKTDTVTYFLNPAESETFPDLLKRGRQIINSFEQNHKNEKVLAVTHGDIGKMIYAAYYNLSWQEVLMSFHFGNCEILMLSADVAPENAHVFKQDQRNH